MKGILFLVVLAVSISILMDEKSTDKFIANNESKVAIQETVNHINKTKSQPKRSVKNKNEIKIIILNDSIDNKCYYETGTSLSLVNSGVKNILTKKKRHQILKRIKNRFFSRRSHGKDIESMNLREQTFESRIVSKINYSNKDIRNYSVAHTQNQFKYTPQKVDLKYWTQSFSVFNSIRKKWNYVRDPDDLEYFADATESLMHFSGDCDDYSIFTASCLKSIGGKVRLIHAPRHLFPELLIGDDFNDVKSIVELIQKLYPQEQNIKAIYFHKDYQGNYWINLDYTRNYPGGYFLKEGIIRIINL